MNSCSSPTNPPKTKPQENDTGWTQIRSDINVAALNTDSTVWACGPNLTGQLGIGSLEAKYDLIQIPRLSGVISIDLYGGMAVAADRESHIWFWGENLYRPAYTPTQVVSPITISHLSNVKQLNICGDYVHLLRADGTVWRFTPNYDMPTEFVNPEMLSGLTNISSISQTLALKFDGTLCEIIHTEPENGGLVPNINGVIAIQNVWNRRTLILKNDGTVWAWGQNGIGQLGNGTYDDSDTPVKVINISDVIKISAKLDYNLALKGDGTAWYWGFEKIVGEHTHIGINSPTKIENLEGVVLIDASSACYFVKNDGRV